MFRLNRELFENLIKLADWSTSGEDEGFKRAAHQQFRRLLFLLGLAVAHELIHVFVGFMAGNSGTDTPPQIQWHSRFGQPNARTGEEAGNAWEGLLMGFNIQAFYNQDSPFGRPRLLLGNSRNEGGERGSDKREKKETISV
ncbi:hypothetical protein QBC38DRAFT_526394 [Podospora fimiseda]|uniref:Uncharacterized protein n=1 Tax=Podospora fimiseda TaxID=252190 RepID=A0AAN6YM83_9PEZI|nr:hypothetical protein QBC38DRAFT_526394 [Podospora fimiseda]